LICAENVQFKGTLVLAQVGFTGMFTSAADTTIAAKAYVGVWDSMIGAQVAKKWLGSCYP